MKQLLPVLVAVLFGSMATLSSAADQVGAVEELSGTASATDQAGATRRLGKGSAVHLGDRIATDADSKLLIRFVDDSTVGQGENAVLVINEYVFSPQSKAENNAAFRLVRGVFRFVTDKITKLNPEGYQVEGNYGTIGIRGCELGFDMNDERDDVLVISLGEREAVLIELQDRFRAGRDAFSTLVRDAGIAVTLSPTEGLVERRFDPSELNRLIQATQPTPGLTAGDDDVLTDDDAGEPPQVRPRSQDQQPPQQPPPQKVDEIVTETPIDQTQEPPSPPQDGAGDGNSPEDQNIDGAFVHPDGSGGNITPPPSQEPSSQDGGNEPNRPTLEPAGPAFRADEGSGAGWAWGIWAKPFTSVDAAGNETRVYKYQLTTTSQNLDPAAYDAIFNQNVRYGLTGSGPAGAFITWGQQSLVLDGEGVFNVQVGGGAPGVWSGDFALGMQSPNQLQFTLSGDIGPGGAVQAGPPANYTLNAFGLSWGTPASTEVGGNLVGPGTAANPISGILIRYSFDHGAGGPLVVGAAGADLQ
jgi:hypothetical protein